MADLREGPGAPPPLFLDQTEARKAEKCFFGDHPPFTYLRIWMIGPPLSEGLDPALTRLYSIFHTKCTFFAYLPFVNGIPLKEEIFISFLVPAVTCPI